MKKLYTIILLAACSINANAQYIKIHDFAGASADGRTPVGDLYSDGTFLYGMTKQGGTTDSGVIFKIMPNGTGFDTLMTFRRANGYNPQGSLFSDGTFLYGMTGGGGANSYGTVFKIKPDGTGYADLHDFSNQSTDGITPLGSLISDGTFLYGMTDMGGTNNKGTIFKGISNNSPNVKKKTI